MSPRLVDAMHHDALLPPIVDSWPETSMQELAGCVCSAGVVDYCFVLRLKQYSSLIIFAPTVERLERQQTHLNTCARPYPLVDEHTVPSLSCPTLTKLFNLGQQLRPSSGPILTCRYRPSARSGTRYCFLLGEQDFSRVYYSPPFFPALGQDFLPNSSLHKM